MPPEPIGDASSVSQALLRVGRLHHLLAWQLQRAAGLHLGQELIMMRLRADDPRCPAGLARLLGSDAATMIRPVQRPENAGLVRRTPCPTDRRAVVIEPIQVSQALRARHARATLVLIERNLVQAVDNQD